MNILLDENFPLQLLRALHEDGHRADHVITLGWRGAPDSKIRAQLRNADVVFLTQDDDFLDETLAATVIVSRVRQGRPIVERVAIWRAAVAELAAAPRAERLIRAYRRWSTRSVEGFVSQGS